MVDHEAGTLPETCARLLTLASHELRTPLSIVQGYLRMLERDAAHPLTDGQRRMVQQADKACLMIATIAAQLSELGATDRDGPPPARDPFDFFAVAERVVAEASESSDRGVTLVHRGEGLAPVSGDRRQLHRALAALARAVLREQPDSTVVVSGCQVIRNGTSATARLVIARERDLEDTWAATPAPLDEARGGSGLALPIARRIIERHGGRVWSPAGQDGTAAPRSGIIVAFALSE